jgi:hypothetical protein
MTYLQRKDRLHNSFALGTPRSYILGRLNVANQIVDIVKALVLQREAETERRAVVNLVASFLVERIDVNICSSAVALRFRVR